MPALAHRLGANSEEFPDGHRVGRLRAAPVPELPPELGGDFDGIVQSPPVHVVLSDPVRSDVEHVLSHALVGEVEFGQIR